MSQEPSGDKRCPKCGLWNVQSALKCDCGYVFNERKLKSANPVSQASFIVSSPMNKAQDQGPSLPEQKALRLKHDSPNTLVLDRVDGLVWPQECVHCGGPVQATDSLLLKDDVRNVGKVEVEVKGIPYCETCFPKIKKSKEISKKQNGFFNWFAGLLVLITLYIVINEQLNYLQCGLGILLCVIIAYGFSWFAVVLPVKVLQGGSLAEPVSGRLQQATLPDGKHGFEVVLTIPNPRYADRLFALNSDEAVFPPKSSQASTAIPKS
jgi:hypothetical protein